MNQRTPETGPDLLDSTREFAEQGNESINPNEAVDNEGLDRALNLEALSKKTAAQLDNFRGKVEEIIDNPTENAKSGVEAVGATAREAVGKATSVVDNISFPDNAFGEIMKTILEFLNKIPGFESVLNFFGFGKAKEKAGELLGNADEALNQVSDLDRLLGDNKEEAVSRVTQGIEAFTIFPLTEEDKQNIEKSLTEENLNDHLTGVQIKKLLDGDKPDISVLSNMTLPLLGEIFPNNADGENTYILRTKQHMVREAMKGLDTIGVIDPNMDKILEVFDNSFDFSTIESLFSGEEVGIKKLTFEAITAGPTGLLSFWMGLLTAGVIGIKNVAIVAGSAGESTFDFIVQNDDGSQALKGVEGFTLGMLDYSNPNKSQLEQAMSLRIAEKAMIVGGGAALIGLGTAGSLAFLGKDALELAAFRETGKNSTFEGILDKASDSKRRLLEFASDLEKHGTSNDAKTLAEAYKKAAESFELLKSGKSNEIGKLAVDIRGLRNDSGNIKNITLRKQLNEILKIVNSNDIMAQGGPGKYMQYMKTLGGFTDRIKINKTGKFSLMAFSNSGEVKTFSEAMRRLPANLRGFAFNGLPLVVTVGGMYTAYQNDNFMRHLALMCPAGLLLMGDNATVKIEDWQLKYDNVDELIDMGIITAGYLATGAYSISRYGRVLGLGNTLLGGIPGAVTEIASASKVVANRGGNLLAAVNKVPSMAGKTKMVVDSLKGMANISKYGGGYGKLAAVLLAGVAVGIYTFSGEDDVTEILAESGVYDKNGQVNEEKLSTAISQMTHDQFLKFRELSMAGIAESMLGDSFKQISYDSDLKVMNIYLSEFVGGAINEEDISIALLENAGLDFSSDKINFIYEKETT